MRINLPVTGVEKILQDSDVIVSKTDTKGLITYINKTFCDISGFTEEELIGAPQNIVRHPDMPPEAFKDLWDTLQAGKSWKGMVKNRCKNGDHYWVEANANPTFENGTVTGYMSLRSKPSREQVEFAESLYRKIREGKARGWKVKEGRALRTGLLGWWDAVRRPTVRMRLAAMVGVLSLACVVVTVLALVGMMRTTHGLETVYTDRLMPVGHLYHIQTLFSQNRSMLRDAINRPAAETIRANKQQYEKNRDEITKLWDEYRATYLTPEEKKLGDQWATERTRFVKEGLDPAYAALTAGRIDEARKLSGNQELLYAPLQETGEKLIQLQVDVGKEEYDNAGAIFAFTRNLLIAVSVTAIGLAILFGSLLVRAIVRPLREVEELSMAVSSGDLTRRIDVTTDDEVGRVLQGVKNVNGNLRGIVQDVRFGSTAIATSSQEVATGGNDLSQRTQEQASALEETASSMEEMTSTVKQNADNARQANQLAAGARDQAEKGGTVVTNAVSAMSEINSSSKKIADIIGVIDEIAFQTNLLALNAAVEAARAGEQGRGFAVVASEVRNLAQRSAAAAKEIKGLIKDSVEKVQTGSNLVNASGQTLSEIVDSVKKVTDIVAEIASASQEQSSGIDQVNKAIMQMDEMTQQNAALVEESSAASRSMEEQALKLNEMMGFFRLGTNDSGIRAGTRRAAKLVAGGPRGGDVADDRKKTKPAAPVASARRATPLPKTGTDQDGSWQEF
jgi:aerotaxis receptor